MSLDGQVRIYPSGNIETSISPYDRLFAQSVGQGLFALATANWDVSLPPMMFYLRRLARDSMTRFAHAVMEHPDGWHEIIDCLIPAQEKMVAYIEELPEVLGGENVTVAHMHHWFISLRDFIRQELEKHDLSPVQWLRNLGAPWDQIGKLFFHLAEHRDDETGHKPFAFMVTFAHQSAADNQLRHLPLGSALKLYADDHAGLMSILTPLKNVSSQVAWVKSYFEQGKMYRPMLWSASEAYEFLQSISEIESAGIMVRMVNLWKTAPPRLQVQVTADAEAPKNEEGGLSVHSLLRFSVATSLGGKDLTAEELAELLAQGDGLIRFKGDWVQLDRAKIESLMEVWQKATHMLNAYQMPLVQGLRLLMGGLSESLPALPEQDSDCALKPSEELQAMIDEWLNTAMNRVSLPLPDSLQEILRPYQRQGVEFLYQSTKRGFGVCLADDMGLGKTLQTIAWLEVLRKEGALDNIPALIVAPASLLGNWQDELSRFAADLKVGILHPSSEDFSFSPKSKDYYGSKWQNYHVVITTYGMVTRVEDWVNEFFPAIVLDEAQAIKNDGSQRSQSVRALQSNRKVALTGTPIENSMMDMWSLMEFLNPSLLGGKNSFKKFVLEQEDNLAPIKRLLHPFILRRMKTDQSIIADLPDKTEMPAYCLLTEEQAALYHHQIQTLHAMLDEPDPQARLMLILPLLAKLKQICNHPAQFQGTDDYAPERSGKMIRLMELCEQIRERQEKVLIFTQFASLIPHLHDVLSKIFGQAGLCLHGGTPIMERRNIVSEFQKEEGPPFCILSLKAAGTGLTLTQASHVIHFDRWWNPAVENQATDRAYRIGQRKNVLVHRFICKTTIEERIDALLAKKQKMSDDMFDSSLEQMLASMNGDELKNLFGIDASH